MDTAIVPREPDSIVLELDDHFPIRSVDQAWDMGAKCFGAEDCAGPSIVVTPVLQHIAGGTTRTFYRQLHAWVTRTGRSFRLPYRCDARSAHPTRHSSSIYSAGMLSVMPDHRGND
ncbi:MAG: hypothetical protein KF814_12065 [Nitrospiraceae bacterium]|nr:hypothetical protein [Nitrospiraceae bacterium]